QLPLAILFQSSGQKLTAEEIFARYPSLLTIANASDLSAAREAFRAGVDLYLQASDLIRARPPGRERLFNYDPETFGDERDFRSLLVDLRNSFEGVVRLHVKPEISLHLDALFNGRQSLRQLLPEFSGSTALTGTLPDATLGGALRGLTEREFEEFLGGFIEFGPWFSRPQLTAASEFQTELHGLPGLTFSLQLSENLQTWSETDRLLTLEDPVPFGGTLPPNRQLFMRAVQSDRPGNDSFDDRATIRGSSVAVRGSNANATRETGEPSHSPFPFLFVNKTVWYTWMAPSDGLLEMYFSESDFPGIMAVYAGGALNALTPVPPANSGLITVRAGTIYQLAVGSFSQQAGRFELKLFLHQPPANDAFANGVVLNGDNARVSGSTIGATLETGERSFPGCDQPRTVWFSWKAPATDRFEIAVDAERGDVEIAVFAGASLGALSEIESLSEEGILFDATAEMTYRIVAVSCLGDETPFELSIERMGVPVNDPFANRILLSGIAASARGSTRGATVQEGEPEPFQFPTGGTIWWQWTPDVSGRAHIEVRSQAEFVALAVFRGSDFATLTPVQASEGDYGFVEVDFAAQAGTSYQLAVSGEPGELLLFAGQPPQITQHPEAQRAIAGSSISLRVEATGSDLSYEWQFDGDPLPGATTPVLLLNNVTTAQAGEYRVVVSNPAGSVRSNPATLRVEPGIEGFAAPIFSERFNDFTFSLGPQRSVHDGQGGLFVYFQPMDMIGDIQVGSPIKLRESDGRWDSSFQLGTEVAYGSALAVQPDGRILIAGSSGNLHSVVRVDRAGKADSSFHPPVFNRGIRFITVQPDGKILLAVTDNLSPGTGGIQVPSPTVFRLMNDGRVDPEFRPPVLKHNFPFLFAPPVVDGNGRVYIAGQFNSVNDTPRVNFARLLPNGDLDANFAASESIAGGVTSVQARMIGFQSDGRIIVAGDFRIPANAPNSERVGAIRFHANGTFDDSFTRVRLSEMGIVSGARARAMAILPDDRILLVSHTLVRLQPNGAIDSSFLRPSFAAEAFWLSMMNDGRIVVPNVTLVNGNRVGGIARFHPNGQFDNSLQTEPFGLATYPASVAPLADNRIAVGGRFNRVGAKDQMGVAILESDGRVAATQMDIANRIPTAVIAHDGVVAPGPNGGFYYLLRLGDSSFAQITRFGRNQADGSADMSFDASSVTQSDLDGVSELFTQSNGQIILVSGGSAQTVVNGGFTIRLNLNGSRDASFQDLPPSLRNLVGRVTRDGNNVLSTIEVGGVRIVGENAQGKLLGIINGIGGVTGLFRLNADGTLDSGFQTVELTDLNFFEDFPNVFDPVLNQNYQVLARVFTTRLISEAVELPDGKILVVGGFEQFGGVRTTGLVRLLADGRVDPSFVPGTGPTLAASLDKPFLDSIARDAQGRVYLAGHF
ncbi:MAG: immunoglobulin domain-containing protein, partial [Verrucomicrobiota bacterium]